jgi:hypothetical protein
MNAGEWGDQLQTQGLDPQGQGLNKARAKDLQTVLKAKDQGQGQQHCLWEVDIGPSESTHKFDLGDDLEDVILRLRMWKWPAAS